MSEEIVVQEQQGIGLREQGELSVTEIIGKVAKVREVASAVMVDGIHYGKIPGTPKPTLYKAGGEILALTFRLAPRYEGERLPIDLGDGHREYIIRCELYHITTGAFIAAGLGSCSTMESKYRYRPGPVSPTGKPVPASYWATRKSDPGAAQASIGGRGHSVRKMDGAWQIVVAGEPAENPNIADVYNTVLKMASKRSYIDAVLKATAASEVYTQDLEDMRANEQARDGNHGDNGAPSPSIETPRRKSAEPPIHDDGGIFDGSEPPAEREPGDEAPQDEAPPPASSPVISNPQRKRMYAKARSAGLNDDQFRDELTRMGFQSSKDVPRDVYDDICAHFDSLQTRG